MSTELTYGQKAVGLTFNPSSDDRIHSIKQRFADLIDEMNNLRSTANSPDRARLASITITELQTAQMWAVKTLTWKD